MQECFIGVSDNYLKVLAQDICKRRHFDIIIIEKILMSLSTVQNAKELNDLLDFVSANPEIKAADINY